MSISSRKTLPVSCEMRSEHGVADGARLLENLLEHEMLEAALFRGDGVPGDVLDLGLDGLAFGVRDLHALGREHGDIAVGEEEHVAGVREDAGNIAGDEVFVFAKADHHRRTDARGDDLAAGPWWRESPGRRRRSAA